MRKAWNAEDEAEERGLMCIHPEDSSCDEFEQV